MLRQVRHISEGNFYGLRVTNKARKLCLDKELRTLEACKHVQSHVFRKEEKELISTLKRLRQTKHDHFDREYHDHSERLPSHHDRRASFHSEQHSNDEQRHLRRPTERNHGKVHVQVKSEVTDPKSSTKVPCKVNVLADTSDVSVIMSLSPVASSVPAAKQTAPSFPPVVQPPAKETGTEIHRTQGFICCVICNLPRYAHGKENSSLCRCHVDPSMHPHHGREHQEGSNKLRRKSHTAEDELKTFATKRERRRSLQIEDLLAPHSAKKTSFSSAAHHRHHGRSRASSFEEDNKTVKARAFDEYTAYVPGVGVNKRNIQEYHTELKDHHVHEQDTRSRGSSFSESRSRKTSLDEGRSRRSSYSDGRSRENSLGEHEEPHYMKPLKGHYGSRHNRTRQEEELHNLYSRLQRTFPFSGEHPHLPLSKSRRDEDEDPAPAFSGLMHPDNIINHHHFLPYEADKQNKPRATTHQAPHPPPHPPAIHIMGIDRHGNRQEVSGIY